MLRYGVIVGPTLRVWELECVRELERSGLARLELVVRHRGIAANVRATRAYDAFAEASGAITQGVYGWLELARMTDSIVSFDPATDDERWKSDVGDAKLDFLLLFGARAIGFSFEGTTRLGVWTFAHGDLSQYECAIPGFWEMYHGYDLTAGFLLKQTGTERAGIVLKSAYLGTFQRSFRGNADAICALMSKWPALVCANIEDGVAGYFSGEALALASKRFGWPTALQAAGVRLRQARTNVGQYLGSRFFSIDWNVGVLDRTAADFIGKDERPRANYLFRGNADDYVADPCLVERGSRTFLFCERYDHHTQRGFLVQTELSAGKATPLQRIIDEDYHLSYPHVFEHGGELYCIPESRAVRKICLYRCVEFPQHWEFVRTLVDDFDGADGTLVSHGGKWWLFCTSSKLVERGFNSQLYLWYADDIFGQWKPHACNPVKMDARSARPAGPAFLHEGALYRPVQDCGGSYGGRVHIARIDTLTEGDYQETLVGTIRPPKGAYRHGIHTISCANGVCVVDARRYRFSPWRIAFALRRLGQRTGLSRLVAYVQRRTRLGTASSD